MTTKSKPRGDWLTVRQLAGVFGITQQGFRASYLGEIGADDIRPGKGRTATTIYAPSVVSIHTERALRRAGRADEDPLHTGPASPQLERWRKARAAREEVELLARMRELQSLADVRAGVLAICTAARRYAERMIQLFGQVPGEDWNETCQQMNQEITRRLRLDARRRELHVWADGDAPIVLDLDLLGQETYGDE